ncbi:MAG: FkbM family methyltransferase [Acidobacteriota bacterium]
MTSLVVDCGANVGLAAAYLADRYRPTEMVCFEPNPALLPILRARCSGLEPVCRIIGAAVWVANGWGDLFLGHPESSTVVSGKVSAPGYDPPIDYSSPLRVPTIDFAAWLRVTARRFERIIIKMDIEGAEYPVLERLVETRAIKVIDRLLVEWHFSRFPTMDPAEHSRIFDTVTAEIPTESWDF